MSAESRIEAARLALAGARQALRKAEAVIDELEVEVATLRAVTRTSGRLSFVCQNPACGKDFTRRAGDIRAGNTSGKFCCRACSVVAKGVGRPRGVANDDDDVPLDGEADRLLHSLER